MFIVIAESSSILQLIDVFGAPAIMVLIIIASARENFIWKKTHDREVRTLERQIDYVTNQLKETRADCDKRLAASELEVNEWKNMTLRLLNAAEKATDVASDKVVMK